MGSASEARTRLLDAEIGVGHETHVPAGLRSGCGNSSFGSFIGSGEVEDNEHEDASYVESRESCGGLESPGSRAGLLTGLDVVQRFSGKLQL
eukprot:c14836_g1_i1 orf=3-275(-)